MASTDSQADGGAERRERGTAIWFIGLAVLIADLLVIFFAPAGIRIGHEAAFLFLIAVLAAAGFGLMIWGRRQRQRAG